MKSKRLAYTFIAGCICICRLPPGHIRCDNEILPFAEDITIVLRVFRHWQGTLLSNPASTQHQYAPVIVYADISDATQQSNSESQRKAVVRIPSSRCPSLILPNCWRTLHHLVFSTLVHAGSAKAPYHENMNTNNCEADKSPPVRRDVSSWVNIGCILIDSSMDPRKIAASTSRWAR